LMNGILLLKILDRIHPGSVNWIKVNISPKNRWDTVLNCNLVVDIIAKEPFDLKTTNIGGLDLADGKLKAILSVVAQIQRYLMIKTLKELKFAGTFVTDDQIREWSNSIASQSPYNFSQPIKKWNDKTLSTGLYFLDLLAVLDTGKTLIDPTQVFTDFNLDESTGVNETVIWERKASNISAAVTLTRKLGGILFVHMQDLIDAKSRATLTLVATILAVGLKMGNFSRSFEQKVGRNVKDVSETIQESMTVNKTTESEVFEVDNKNEINTDMESEEKEPKE